MTNLISIVLPVHNEFDNLQTLLEEWDSELKNISAIKHEFVIVEDGSTDGTKELIIKLQNKYPIKNLSSDQKRGYSKAVLDGIKASSGKYILCTDSDNQIKVQSLIDNIDQLPAKNLFLFGNRNPRNDPANRIIYSKLFKILHDMLFYSKLSDLVVLLLLVKETYAKLPEKSTFKNARGFLVGFCWSCKKKIKF